MKLATLSDAAAALIAVPADDRDVWIRMGMALKSEFGDDAFAVWDDWSQSSEKYRESDARNAWRSFRDGGIGIGTLFYEAKAAGWQPGAIIQHLPPTPKKKPPTPIKSDTQAYGLSLWESAEPNVGHPYALAKGIDWEAGTRRVRASGRVIGSDADCLLVPLRDLGTFDVKAIQAINTGGAKQTFGPRAGRSFICGNTSNPSIPWAVVEGWADAVSFVFHHHQGNAVAVAVCGKDFQAVTQGVVDVFAPVRLEVWEDAA